MSNVLHSPGLEGSVALYHLVTSSRSAEQSLSASSSPSRHELLSVHPQSIRNQYHNVQLRMDEVTGLGPVTVIPGVYENRLVVCGGCRRTEHRGKDSWKVQQHAQTGDYYLCCDYENAEQKTCREEYNIPLPAGYTWDAVTDVDRHKTSPTVYFRIPVIQCYSDTEDEESQLLWRAERAVKRCVRFALQETDAV